MVWWAFIPGIASSTASAKRKKAEQERMDQKQTIHVASPPRCNMLRESDKVQRPTESTRKQDDSTDLLNPLNPLSPLSPIHQSFYNSYATPVSEPASRSECHESSSSSHDSGSSHSSSHSSCSSSSYDSSSSSSYDSGSSSSSSSYD